MCFNVARMFVQVTKCKHGSATYFTYLVRESFRTPKGPRSRTICNITALPPETRELISRSEEHTSELQSRLHIVCRLLLEKKKIIFITGYGDEPHVVRGYSLGALGYY